MASDDRSRPGTRARPVFTRQDITVTYGPITAVSGWWTSTCARRDRVGLIGPSGAEGTTFVDARPAALCRHQGGSGSGDADLADLIPIGAPAPDCSRSFRDIELYESLTVMRRTVSVGVARGDRDVAGSVRARHCACWDLRSHR